MRILHLVKPPSGTSQISNRFTDDGTDAGMLACAAAIQDARQRSPAIAHEVLAIGSTAQGRRAQAIGLDFCGRIAPPLGITGFARFGLRRFLQDRGDVGIVQCWARSLVPLAQAACTRERVLPPPPVLALSDRSPARPDRATLRADLGIAASDFCVLLLADPPFTGDVRSFAFVLGLFEVAGHVTVGVVPRGVIGWSRARRFVKVSDLRCRLVLADRPAALLAAACDVAVSYAEPESFDGAPVPRHAERLAAERAAVNCCHRQGVPVVCVRGRGLDDMNAHTPELLIDSDHANHIGRAVLSLKTDRVRLEDLSRRVLAAAESHSPGEVVHSWLTPHPAAGTIAP